MGYHDGFDGQRPPWEDAEQGGYGRYTGPQPSAYQPPADEFQRAEFPREGSRRGDDTSVDSFRPITPAPLDGRDYGVTSDEDYAPRTGPQERYGRGLAGAGRRTRGVLAGGTAGFLAAGLALGVANFAAAFVRPQASPIIAVGGAFIDRTPSWLKNFAVEKFGENDKTMLLLGLYVTIAVIAVVVGMIAWRHVWVGVAGIGAFGAFGAFVAYTRPESHPTDVIPALAGGLAGIIAIAWMAQWTRARAGGGPQGHGLSRPGTGRSEWAA